MKQKSFWVGASIGFALILIKTCACTWNADMSTIAVAIGDLLNIIPLPINPVSLFYLVLMVLPVATASLCGFMCRIIVGTIGRLTKNVQKMRKSEKR